MNQVIINKSLKIQPVPHESFISSDRETFEEVGILIAKDETITDIPIGARVYFQSWMAEKYPNLEKEGSFHWIVPYSEVRMYEYE
jgi:8-oxo-dGTP pyrophosphatase MutT (NUDIX family)